MNQVFLEERSREKVKDLLNEGVRSQEIFRNRANIPNHFHHLARGIVIMLEPMIQLLRSKKKHPVVSHNPS